ncbi:MAG: Crp/Fnr family transcriptional regulator [Lysobacteraceae bacterium]|nr:MAG: Crp/Fnr family transcriptional regulator [Xanthomonadaceae bacterium]
MASSHARHPNNLLASLPAAYLAELGTALEWVPMRLGQILYEPGQRLSHAYFPSSAVVSLHCVTSSGASAETAGVGHEGVVGVPLFLGGETTCSSAMVHTGGHGWRLDRHRLLQEFARGGVFRNSLLRYTQALIVQLVQTAACYRHHSIEQQLSAWLMATFDRMPAEDVVMTQELLGSLLGVRRESVTQAAGKLHGMGYISYRRGHISVLDPAGLRANACECYGVMRREMLRLAPGVPATPGQSSGRMAD